MRAQAVLGREREAREAEKQGEPEPLREFWQQLFEQDPALFKRGEYDGPFNGPSL